MNKLVIPLLILALAACSSNPVSSGSSEARVAAVNAAAGEPVPSINTSINRPYDWERISQHQLVVYTSAGKAWLFDLGYCPQYSASAQSISIPSHAGRVAAGVDRVHGLGGRCLIEKIRPLDVRQLDGPRGAIRIDTGS